MDRIPKDPRRLLKAEKWAWLFVHDIGLFQNTDNKDLYNKYLHFTEGLSDLTAAQRVLFCLFVQEAEADE